MEEKNVQSTVQTDLQQTPSPVSPSENYQVVEALQKMPSLVSRGLIYLVILALITGLVYSLLARIDVVAQCRAIATPVISPVNIQAVKTGYVKRVYVSEGQRVEKNSPLFSIRSKSMTRFPADASGPLEYDAAAPAIPQGKAAEGTAETVVTSPAEGTVVHLFITYPGAYVEESAPLCNILPADDRLSMHVRATNREIGFIQKNMEIKYKFDAFPYTDFGLLYGRVMDIPEAAVEDENAGLIYHVQGTLDKAYFDLKGKKYFLKAGMTATAELVRERTSIFAMLFKRGGG
jgi:multidrug efflux pump subunit AcrA (membrane-fusion protein)